MTALESSVRRELDGLVAIVTGGASGIGRATALRLADLGAEVITFDLTDEVAEPLTGLIVDISSRSSVDAGMATVDKCFGRLDILVNNAGQHLLDCRNRGPTVPCALLRVEGGGLCAHSGDGS